MSIRALRPILAVMVLFGAWIGVARAAETPAAPPASLLSSKARVVEALRNILTLERPGQDGYATVWDGNKFIQCGAVAGEGLRCEAAGSRMQPSLSRLLTPERLDLLVGLGWRRDPAFGEYVQIFPARASADEVADRLMLTLGGVYGADIADLDVQTDWLDSEPCPPRNGPSQNLAGVINDSPAMAATAVHACYYFPAPDGGVSATSVGDLIAVYGARVAGEIQRIRVNRDRQVFVTFDADIGYVQCEPQDKPAALYCEAESADEWPALASVLVPDRIARLHALGYADPGRGPNYWKAYPLDGVSDGAIADEVLTVLHDVYGYTGAEELAVKTEKGETP